MILIGWFVGRGLEVAVVVEGLDGGLRITWLEHQLKFSQVVAVTLTFPAWGWNKGVGEGRPH